MSQHEEGPMRLLPDDVLADVLRRAAPRGLATARGVCRAWRALVDSRRLLRADLLPLSLAGLFINYNELSFAELFHRRRPSSVENLCISRVRGHCNGVLLLYSSLFNPATGWRAPLPKSPPPSPCVGMEHCRQDEYLVFDPAVSSHCEVFLIPRVPLPNHELAEHEYLTAATLESEWPPSPCVLNVFSTTTGGWTERSFSREGEAAGTVADMQQDDWWWLEHRKAVYWSGALYVLREHNCVMRLSLSDDTYRIIRPPCGIETMSEFPGLWLGRSEKGVYCALIDDDEECRFRVWILDESSCSRPMEWVMRHDSGCQPTLNYFPRRGNNGPWILENVNANHCFKGDHSIEAPVEEHESSGWNSDDEDVLLNAEDGVENLGFGSFQILGFHPFKEIVFLGRSLRTRSLRTAGLAYHLNTSKLEELGNISPEGYSMWVVNREIESCFPYTPCRIGELPGSSS